MRGTGAGETGAGGPASAGGVLVCPVCGQPLLEGAHGADCPSGHHYDRAREGYLNLLRTSKPGRSTGDPKEAARSRRAFLDKGYYLPLREALAGLVGELAGETGGATAQGAGPGAAAAEARLGGPGPAASGGPARDARPPAAPTPPAPAQPPARPPVRLLDICCGEGYYTSALGALPGVEAWGFDLSKEMVRLAAKRGGAECFVANLKAIPVADGAFDVATHLFAPFDAGEFARVLRPGGSLLSVVPGARHLFGLKQALYDTPYLNDERLPLDVRGADEGRRLAGAEAGGTEGADGAGRAPLRLVRRVRVAADIRLASPEDIDAVFRMTPYYYRTRPADRARLAGLRQLDTPIEFVIGVYLRG